MGRVRGERPHRGPPWAHGLGSRARSRARRPGGHPPVAGGRVPAADRVGAAATGAGRVVSTARLTLFQLHYVNKAFWRNPASAFFTFAFPLMFLVIFTALLGHGTVLLNGHEVHQSTYYVAEMAAFSVITACYNNVAIGLTFQRDTGVLKRTDGTPLPAAVYFTARVLHAVLVAVLLVAITVAFG